MLFRIIASLAALALFCSAEGAAARPFTVEDMLHQESLGAVSIDPSGRWLVLEHRGHYDSARRYDYNTENSLALGRLEAVDLRSSKPARPLLARDAGPGVVMGPFSPSGRRLAIYRLHGHKWSLGVVTLATGAVRWLPQTPQETGHGRSLQWLSDTDFLLIERGDHLPPYLMRLGWIVADRLPKAWEAAATGAGSHTLLGSGTYAAVRHRAPANRLLRINAATGAATRLATGELIDLEVSPDHRRVALFSSGPDIQVRGDGPVRGPEGLETEATRLSIVDLTTGRQTAPCPSCDLLPQLLSWSPSGRSLLGLARGPDGLWTSGHLIRIDAESGLAMTVGDGLRLQARFNPVTVWTTWMGEDPVVLGRPLESASTRDDWYRLGAHGVTNLTRSLPAPDNVVRVSDRQGLAVLCGTGIWAVDARGEAPTRLAEGAKLAQRPPRPVAQARLDRSPQAGFWITLETDRTRALRRLDATGLHALLDLPIGSSTLLAASQQGAAAVTDEIDAHGVERLRLSRASGTTSQLLTLNAGLAETDPLDVRAVHHLGPNGRPLVSWLFLPPPQPGAGPPPLLVRAYLGDNFPRAPRDPPAELGFPQNLRVLTGHGYAVLAVSLPKPDGGLTDPADHLADRILDVVRAAADDPDLAPRFDANRLALTGFSFGGYTVMTAVTQTHRFRAAVEMDGISDLTALWASVGQTPQLNPEMGYSTNWHTGDVEATQPTMLAPPWVETGRYLRNSPLLAANRIETPLLLIHGGQDSLPMAQSEAMYSALFRQGKDALMVTYWGALHSITSPGDIRDVYRRTFRFLDEHLGGDVMPAAGSR